MEKIDTKELEARFKVDLIPRRILYLGNNMELNDVIYVSKAITWMNAQDTETPIQLRINSNGGSTPVGLDIYDIVRESKAPVTGVVMCRSDSIASIVLQGCAKRISLPHATMLLHRVSTELRLHESVSAGDTFDWGAHEQRMKKVLQEGEKYQAILEKIYSDRARQDIQKIRSLVAGNGTHLNAQEALALNLVDEVRG